MTPGTSWVWRARLVRVLGVLVVFTLIELALWRFFLASSYYRVLFQPVALLVGLAGLAMLWRALRPRGAERREHERRHETRRGA